MKEFDLTLTGVTHSAKNGRYDQLLVTMAVSSCVENGADGAKVDFSVPPLVTVSIEPYRLVIPLNDKFALTRSGSEVVFRITGSLDSLKVTMVKVSERKDVSLEDFISSVYTEE